MGPRSENRGYDEGIQESQAAADTASMGPRSDNRGYALRGRLASHPS